MKNRIAYCGLDCAACDAYLATVRDDPALRERTAKLWSELNHADIRPEDIRCEGCREDGVKTAFCNRLCPIRKCARQRGAATCGGCAELETCPTVAPILANNPDARQNLRR